MQAPNINRDDVRARAIRVRRCWDDGDDGDDGDDDGEDCSSMARPGAMGGGLGQGSVCKDGLHVSWLGRRCTSQEMRVGGPVASFFPCCRRTHA